jgi:hypothetical protein
VQTLTRLRAILVPLETVPLETVPRQKAGAMNRILWIEFPCLGVPQPALH